jgi:hypothetical protein
MSSTLGHLDKGGEDDEDDNGSSKTVGVGKDEDHASLETEEGNGMNYKTPTHSHLGVHLVREKSSKTTSKEIHPSKKGKQWQQHSRWSGQTPP